MDFMSKKPVIEFADTVAEELWKDAMAYRTMPRVGYFGGYINEFSRIHINSGGKR